MANRPAQIESIERILVRGVNWLGDAIMTTPALQRLRQRFPSAQISLLTHQKLAELWQHHPSLDQVISFGSQESIWSTAKRIRRENFQLALILPNSPRSALEAWLARIPQRIGYARFGGMWCLTQSLRPPAGGKQTRKRSLAEIQEQIHSKKKPAVTSPQQGTEQHQIFHYLRLTAALGANPEAIRPFLAVSSEEIINARLKFDLACVAEGGDPIFALNPGAEYGPAKRWPVERFAETARNIRSQHRCRWVVLGGPGDAALAAQTLNAIGKLEPEVINLAGRTSLRELCAVLKLSEVLLTNDTGPMHLAAAVGTPVVAIFGSTAPELTGPGLPGATNQRLLTSKAPCSPCFRRNCPIDFRCMTGISSPQVTESLLSVIAALGRNQSLKNLGQPNEANSRTHD